jgi:hypothetical protein
MMLMIVADRKIIGVEETSYDNDSKVVVVKVKGE